MSSPIREKTARAEADLLAFIKKCEEENRAHFDALLKNSPQFHENGVKTDFKQKDDKIHAKENKTRNKPFFERFCLRALKWYHAKRVED